MTVLEMFRVLTWEDAVRVGRMSWSGDSVGDVSSLDLGRRGVSWAHVMAG